MKNNSQQHDEVYHCPERLDDATRYRLLLDNITAAINIRHAYFPTITCQFDHRSPYFLFSLIARRKCEKREDKAVTLHTSLLKRVCVTLVAKSIQCVLL